MSKKRLTILIMDPGSLNKGLKQTLKMRSLRSSFRGIDLMWTVLTENFHHILEQKEQPPGQLGSTWLSRLNVSLGTHHPKRNNLIAEVM